jgi:hypothetical protein
MRKKISPKLFNQSRNRLPAMLVAVAVVIAVSGFGVYQYDSHKVPASHAMGSPSQYCYSLTNYCLNAWGGGPWVRVYHVGAFNNDFGVEEVGFGSNWYIEDYGVNKCIGDGNNSPGDARAYLDPCPSATSGGGGWGTNFTLSPCGGSGLIAFHNNRWNGYLAPTSNSSGASFYLNSKTQYCFQELGPYGAPTPD